MPVTNIEEIKNQALGQEVKLPGWHEGKVTFRLKRTSLLKLAKQGNIPNPLLGVAQKIFLQGGFDNKTDFNDIENVLRIVAKDSLVDPTWQQLKENGITLTDEQLILIFNYAQEGVRALENFRKQQKLEQSVENIIANKIQEQMRIRDSKD